MKLEGETPHEFAEQSKGAGLAHVISSLLGWWSLTGPFRTIAILTNDGNRKTVASLIAEQRWGVKVHDGAVDVAPQVESRPRLTRQAVDEVERLRRASGFEDGLGIRLVPDRRDSNLCEVQFDYPVSDGNQVIIRADGVTLVIDRKDLSIFEGKFLHFDGDEFLVCDFREDKPTQ